MRGVLAGGLHCHGLVQGRVERLPLRVDDREARPLEGLQQQAQRRFLPLRERRGVGARRRVDANAERVGNGEQVRGEALDAELPGRLDFPRRTLAVILEFGDGAQEVGAMLLRAALGFSELLLRGRGARGLPVVRRDAGLLGFGSAHARRVWGVSRGNSRRIPAFAPRCRRPG
jgi:hypothetical protein